MGKRKFNPEKASKAIGLRVRELREQRGWTLEDTEEHGWKEWTHLQRIESGKNITVHTLINLANLFGVHPSEFFSDL
jgi:transcriptional regulator with XRE-family HTH domain